MPTLSRRNPGARRATSSGFSTRSAASFALTKRRARGPVEFTWSSPATMSPSAWAARRRSSTKTSTRVTKPCATLGCTPGSRSTWRSGWPSCCAASAVSALELIDHWPVDHAAAVVIAHTEVVATRGDIDRPYPLASVTKLLTAYAALVAVEEGAVALDEPAGPATLRHLLAHASGMAPDDRRSLAKPGRRRIYSNAGFEVLGEHLGSATGVHPTNYVPKGVIEPLAMGNTIGAS